MISSSAICRHTKMGNYTNTGAQRPLHPAKRDGATPPLAAEAAHLTRRLTSPPPRALYSRIHVSGFRQKASVLVFCSLGHVTTPSLCFPAHLWMKMSCPSLIIRTETMMRKKTLTNLFPFKIASRVPTREPNILQRAMKTAAL
jgi:hypothetical protein